MTLSFYITRRFLMNVLKVQLGIFTLILLLNATEQLRFLENKNADLTMTIWVIMTSLPQVLSITFPLVILLASLFTFLSLSRSSEMVVVRASGVSALKVLKGPIITAVILGVISVAIVNPIVAANIRKHEELKDSFSGKNPSLLSFSKDGLWLRQATENNNYIIQARSSARDGTLLFDVRFHEFDPEGTLISRIEADRANLQDGSWRLTQATQWRFLDKNLTDTSDIGQFDELLISTDLTSDKIIGSFAAPEKTSIWEIPRFISQLEASGFTSIRHRTFFQSQLSTPLLLAAMVLTGAVFAFRPSRFGNSGIMALLAILSGFLLFALKNVAESLGEAQEVPVLLAAWAPATAALLIALSLLLHLEDG